VDEALLARLGVSPPDRAEMLAARPSPGDPLVDRLRRELLDGMGQARDGLSWPEDAPPYLYPWVLLSTVDDVLEYHRSRGIPEDVSWATLADLGQQLRVGRRRLGRSGLTSPGWLTLHFRGDLYQLGRLQWQRTLIPLDRLRTVWPWASEALPALSVHIPAIGPLDPAACDESFAQATAFFAKHFPEVEYRHAICHSWLLDSQLREYLPAGSNILRFQERFEPVPPDPADAPDDAQVIELVFERRPDSLDALPTETALQRAIVAHLRAGRHWYFRTGWCPL
jgi:hypothetical protein